MFHYDWQLALVCMTAAPLVVYPLVRLGQRVRKSTKRGQEELEHVTHLAAEAFTGHRIVKAFGAEGREADRFSRASERLYRTNMRITSAVSALPPLMEFIGGIAAVGALWYGAQRIRTGDLTPGAFTSFLDRRVHDVRPDQEAQPRERRPPAGDRRGRADLRDARHAQRSAREARRAAAPRLRETVEFRDVGFAYDDRPERFVLRHVSLTVRAGQVVGARRAERRRQDDARESDSRGSSTSPRARS